MLDEEPVAEVGEADRLEAEEAERGEDEPASGTRGTSECKDDQDIVSDVVKDNSQDDEDSDSMETQKVLQNQRPQRNRRYSPDQYRESRLL